MTYLLKNKSKNQYRWKIISVIISFCLISLFNFLFPNLAHNLSYQIARPVWFLKDSITKPISNVKGYFISKDSLVARNLALEDELLSLRLKAIDYEILSKEYEILKNKLGRHEELSRIVSRILSKPPFSPYDTFVIDVGSSDGLVLGSRVYLSDNIIIGLIKNITPHTSLVELFSSNGIKQETVLSRTGASFILKGSGGANFELEVPKDTDIILGDVFLYPKFSPSIFGSVYYIDANSQNSFKKIYIRVPANVFSTKYVFVEKGR